MAVIPNGFQLAGHHCGLKQETKQEDLALIVADAACVAAGVYTQNRVVAAPVLIDRERTPAQNIRAVVVNSGNANACTGPQGIDNALRMLSLTAEATGCQADEVLVMSTGIIGEQLPMQKISAGIEAAAKRLGREATYLEAAARGILTTDTRIKIANQTVPAHPTIEITGMAKGSGMIGPSMATMLSIILTDATLTPELAQSFLEEAVQDSYHCISVDGHTSTNDTVLLLVSGQGDPFDAQQLDGFRHAFQAVCVDLAKQIVADGEGASHLIEIAISGAANDADAKKIAQTIADSPLVKTAIAGNDPNWGRIVSAAGYAKSPINVARTCLSINGIRLFQDAAPVAFDAAKTSASIEGNRDVLIELSVGDGPGTARFWTCDLTHEYVTINAEYHT